MAIALKKRRVVVAKGEAVRGTAESITASVDAIPMIRDATFEITPIQVERPTLRLSLTDYPDIYPGKATVRLRILCEVSGRDSGFPGTLAPFLKLVRACGYRLWSAVDNVFAYKVSVLTTDNGPLRHGELLAGTALVDADNICIGDAWSHDGGALTTIFVSENTTAAGISAGTITSQRGAAETVFTVNARSSAQCLGFSQQSDVNAQTTATVGIFVDGKQVLAQGCMGNVEFQFNHGDAALAQFEMQGVLNTYGDLTLPTNAFEGHKVPPVFLGTRLTLGQTINNPSATNRYGTGGSGAGITGALSQVRLSTGNNVVLPTNSLDPNGINFALITARKPVGSFNPTEVASATEFDFITRFVAGTPARMKILLGATDHATPSTQDQNSFDFLTPGIVFTGMADQERDGINIWDAGFDMTGGDYDSTALGEKPGQDNEFVIVHR